MYQHHEESLKIMEKMFREREEVIALVFGGSVAKGMERPDSDLDGFHKGIPRGFAAFLRRLPQILLRHIFHIKVLLSVCGGF